MSLLRQDLYVCMIASLYVQYVRMSKYVLNGLTAGSEWLPEPTLHKFILI